MFTDEGEDEKVAEENQDEVEDEVEDEENEDEVEDSYDGECKDIDDTLRTFKQYRITP